MDSFLLSLQLVFNQIFAQLVVVFPRILGAVIILWLGLILADWVRKVISSLFSKMEFSKAFQKTPVEDFLKSIGLETIENVLSTILYWLLVLVVIQTSVSVLGLTTLTLIFASLFGYLPSIVSALVVLVIGIVLAGFAESFVKQALRGFEVHTARAAGRFMSYVVVTLSGLIAISELGIARDFILIIFIGFVSIISLGLGLALGLGGKNLVEQMLESWYKRVRKNSPTEKPE